MPVHNITLTICVYLYESYVNECGISGTIPCDDPGLGIIILREVFIDYNYIFKRLPVSMAQVDANFINILLNSTCDCMITALETTTALDDPRLVVATPHMQFPTGIAMPVAFERSSFLFSFEQLASPYSMPVWFCILALGILNVFTMCLAFLLPHHSRDDRKWRWRLIRSVFPGQASEMPVPKGWALKLSYVIFVFFFGYLVTVLYGNTLAVQLQQRQLNKPMTLDELLDKVEAKERTFVDIYDWSNAYADGQSGSNRLRAALASNPIKVASSFEEMNSWVQYSDEYVYLDYFKTIYRLWNTKQLQCDRQWTVLDANSIEDGGWASYVFVRNRTDIDLDHLDETINTKRNRLGVIMDMDLGRIPDCLSPSDDLDQKQSLQFKHIKGALLMLTAGLFMCALYFCVFEKLFFRSNHENVDSSNELSNSADNQTNDPDDSSTTEICDEDIQLRIKVSQLLQDLEKLPGTKIPIEQVRQKLIEIERELTLS